MQTYLSFAIQNPDLYQLCFERPVPGFVPSEKSMQLSFGILERYYNHLEQTYRLHRLVCKEDCRTSGGWLCQRYRVQGVFSTIQLEKEI